MTNQLLKVFKNTYPKPKYCVSERLGAVAYDPEPFTSKELIFRDAASQFGLDTTNARFVDRVENWQGRRVDLSKLIIPIETGDNYYHVGFFS